jgi:hypothetical protein
MHCGREAGNARLLGGASLVKQPHYITRPYHQQQKKKEDRTRLERQRSKRVSPQGCYPCTADGPFTTLEIRLTPVDVSYDHCLVSTLQTKLSTPLFLRPHRDATHATHQPSLTAATDTKSLLWRIGRIRLMNELNKIIKGSK